MKRLPGVIFSAILLVLGSLFQLLIAVCMGLGAAVEQKLVRSGGHLGAGAAAPFPAWMPVFTYGLSAFFVALGVWGILTAIGLFRVRRWARYSILVIGGCLTLIGLPSMLITLVLLAIPLPLPATVDPAQANAVHSMTRVVFGVVAVFYGIICAVGISWLAYFNLKNVRELFASAPGQVAESRRPFLISVVAVLLMIGAVSCLLMAFLPLPAAFLGFTLYGWEKAAVLLVYAVLLAAAGVGLWRLEEWGRRLAIAMQAIGLVQYVVYIARPSLMTRYSEEINRMMNLPQAQPPVQLPTMFYIPVFGFSILFLIAIVWILIHYRGAFVRPVVPPQAESPTLP
jgi:uncharacterized membrane protein (DUF2068 family)